MANAVQTPTNAIVFALYGSVSGSNRQVTTVRSDFADENTQTYVELVFSHKGILQMHGFYIDFEEQNISFDIIIDFKVKNKDEVYKEIYDEIQKKYKDYKVDINLDIDISD